MGLRTQPGGAWYRLTWKNMRFVHGGQSTLTLQGSPALVSTTSHPPSKRSTVGHCGAHIHIGARGKTLKRAGGCWDS